MRFFLRRGICRSASIPSTTNLLSSRGIRVPVPGLVVTNCGFCLANYATRDSAFECFRVVQNWIDTSLTGQLHGQCDVLSQLAVTGLLPIS